MKEWHLIERLPYAPADEYEQEKNMKEFISKEELIERNNEFLYDLLIDFLNLEITEDSFDLVYNFVELPHFRNGEYEGNQYILKKVNTKEVLIYDMIIEEIGETFTKRTLKLSVQEFLYIMDHIDYWRKNK